MRDVMSRESAIKELCRMMNDRDRTGAECNALKMGIKAIENGSLADQIRRLVKEEDEKGERKE